MPLLSEDKYLSDQADTRGLVELEHGIVGVVATYWLGMILDSSPAHEPLLPALAGLTGVESHINNVLDLWEDNNMVPLFIFDGQSLTGQDDVTTKRARAANERTNHAWQLYADSHATDAVNTFGQNHGAYNVKNLYPVLQQILKKRSLHFLVAPYNACAQLGYFEMIDSDMCCAVMGPQELLLYPIGDMLIRSIDWDNRTVSAISKKKILQRHAIGDATLIDAILMTGTSFLPPFPAMEDGQINPMGSTFQDAVNYLRTSQKDVAVVCSAFQDAIKARDPDWLDKYQKARLAVHHFIYVAESGELKVNDYEHLTGDNHEYLGLQLPAELFHYLNTGLIGASIMNCITHGQIKVQPPFDGQASEEYKKLVTSKLVPIQEQAVGLVVPRIHRGIAHKEIKLRVWFDENFQHVLNHNALNPPPSVTAFSWDVKDKDLKSVFPPDFAGPVALEILALLEDEFVPKTKAKDRHIKGIDSADNVISMAIFRFLHLRGYVDDSHEPNTWGNALATVIISLREATESLKGVEGLEEAAILAVELIKLGLLTGKPREERAGYPRKGTDEEKASLALISEVASLLKLRHQAYGYTGPLNRSLLAFRSLSTTVRETDRFLIDAIIANMFMYGQCQRERDDSVEIARRLPFSRESDIALGIAVRTFFDDDDVSIDAQTRAAKLESFPETFVPFATALVDDFRVAVAFFSALNLGVQSLEDKLVAPEVKQAWTQAQEYLDARPF